MKSKIKNIIKNIPGFNFINRIRKNYKLKKEFSNDYKFFKNNYVYSKQTTKEKLEYEMILEIHKLEKGFAVVNPRPFGIDKIKKIIELIKKFESCNYERSFSYNLAYSSLEEYKKFYEEKDWIDTEQYKIVNQFLSNGKEYDYISVGAHDLIKKDFIEDSKIDFDKFISSRKSVRNFAPKELLVEDINKAVNMAIKSPSACNRQMCKVYYIDSDNNKKVIEKYAQGLGLFDLTNANYFVITFDISANYFIGERNQGWFNAGLFSMNFVNALHSLGIGSCFIQFGNSFKEEQEMKKIFNIPDSERIAVIITAGYYDEISRIPYSTRKNIEDIYRKI